jgi:hypothetical protein
MGSLIVVIAVAALAFIWIRGTRRNRAQWLARLDLPGVSGSGRVNGAGSSSAESWIGGVIGSLRAVAARRTKPDSGTWKVTPCASRRRTGRSRSVI